MITFSTCDLKDQLGHPVSNAKCLLVTKKKHFLKLCQEQMSFNMATVAKVHNTSVAVKYHVGDIALA